jgi:membrane protein implicated in regulation of membrane protease activity
MVARVLEELGPWAWWVLGLALLAAEILVPGVFLVWIGMAAILTGALALLFWNADLFGWHVQLPLFALLSVACVFAGRRLLSHFEQATDAPLLNQRGRSLIGRTAVLEEPIAEGRGRIRLGDTTWPVSGPDLPVGTRVRVVSSDGQWLTVDAAPVV